METMTSQRVSSDIFITECSVIHTYVMILQVSDCQFTFRRRTLQKITEPYQVDGCTKYDRE